jgi:hypothetical protein
LNENEETKRGKNEDWDEDLDDVQNPVLVNWNLDVNVFPIAEVK